MKTKRKDHKVKTVRLSEMTHRLLLHQAERETRRPAHVADRILRAALEELNRAALRETEAAASPAPTAA